MKRNGFSLIELLVVITIIGILAGVGLTSYRSANMKARDSRRQADIQAIQSALEVYRSENGDYPDALNSVGFSNYFSNNIVPTDPNSDECGYTYTPSGFGYELSYCLETDNVGSANPLVVHNP